MHIPNTRLGSQNPISLHIQQVTDTRLIVMSTRSKPSQATCRSRIPFNQAWKAHLNHSYCKPAPRGTPLSRGGKPSPLTSTVKDHFSTSSQVLDDASEEDIFRPCYIFLRHVASMLSSALSCDSQLFSVSCKIK